MPCCTPATLCTTCLDRSCSWLAGTAAAQGTYWASRVAWRLRGCAEPWPDYAGHLYEFG